VKSQFGWHVIKVEDKRSKPLPDFAMVKPQIDQYLERKAQQDIIVGLREKAKVERLDQPAAPAAPAEPKKP
jgi:peptidyl-prolyl cis-trans isomerase C